MKATLTFDLSDENDIQEYKQHTRCIEVYAVIEQVASALRSIYKYDSLDGFEVSDFEYLTDKNGNAIRIRSSQVPNPKYVPPTLGEKVDIYAEGYEPQYNTEPATSPEDIPGDAMAEAIRTMIHRVAQEYNVELL